MKKRVRYTLSLIGCSIILIHILCIPLVQSLHSNMASYGYHELDYFISMMINHASFDVDETNDSLIQILQNEDGSVKSVDFDLLKANKMASSMALNLEELLLKIQNGHYQKVDNSEYESRLYEVSQHKGLICHIPLATILKIPILSSFLPTIPVYYQMDHAISSSLRPVIKDYGINQVALILYADMTIKQTMLIPFFDDDITLKFSIPIALRIVNGEVPQFYVTS